MLTILTPSTSFTRPNDTTAYASGDLVANSATAGSVLPVVFTFGSLSHDNVFIRRLKITKSGTSVTNSQFRVHFYKSLPTCANGDNGAFSTNAAANYLGAIDVNVDQAFTDGASGIGVPNIGSEINGVVRSGSLCALVEARAAYTPAAQEVFTLEIEAHRY